MVKYITLCADDYGQNPEISQAIVELIHKKSLSATSCMTTATDWLQSSNYLIPFKEKVDIGLHFNLTESKPLVMKSFYSLKKLIFYAYSHQLDTVAIEAELNAQLDQFVAGIGRLPDFIDGHQHIHQLPMIRDILMKVYHNRLQSKGIYMRSLWDSQSFFRLNSIGYFKQNILQLLGAHAFKKLLLVNQIPHNTSFAGIYPFNHSSRYPAFFMHFLSQISTGGLIMCHPGLMNKNDLIAKSRQDEYQFFSSDLFLELNKQSAVIIARFNHNLSSEIPVK